MWVPLLLTGAAVAGIIIAKKMLAESGEVTGEETVPDVPPAPPPDVINLSWEGAKSLYGGTTTDLVFVRIKASNFDQPSADYDDARQFTSATEASIYMNALVRFFEANKGMWMCPSGGFIEVSAYGWDAAGNPIEAEWAKTKSWCCDCDGTTKVASAGLAIPINGTQPSKPINIVSYSISSGYYQGGETYIFASDAEAEVYYRLLRSFFEQPEIYKAYTSPTGTIFLSKYGSGASVARYAIWQDGMYLPNAPGMNT